MYISVAIRGDKNAGEIGAEKVSKINWLRQDE